MSVVVAILLGLFPDKCVWLTNIAQAVILSFLLRIDTLICHYKLLLLYMHVLEEKHCLYHTSKKLTKISLQH